MGVALIGFLGVIIGALVTGGIQTVQAWSQRRGESSAAARLLVFVLFEASSQINAAINTKAWSLVDEDWERYSKAWADNRGALARVLSGQDFADVAGGFLAVEMAASRRLGGMKQLSDPTQQSSLFGDPQIAVLRVYLHSINLAEPIVWNLGLTRSEKRANPAPESPLTAAQREWGAALAAIQNPGLQVSGDAQIVEQPGVSSPTSGGE